MTASTSIVSLLQGIREGFGIDIWIRIRRSDLDIVEKNPIDNKERVLKTCYSLDAVKQFLSDLITCEEVFSSCEIANTIESRYGISACCHFKQNNIRCDSYNDESTRCQIGTLCPNCGELRILSFDRCYGHIELCVNPGCEYDK